MRQKTDAKFLLCSLISISLQERSCGNEIAGLHSRSFSAFHTCGHIKTETFPLISLLTSFQSDQCAGVLLYFHSLCVKLWPFTLGYQCGNH